MLLMPCEPTPIEPIIIRSLGGTTPFIPIADEGIMCGSTIVPATNESEFLKKFLRVLLFSISV